MGDPALRLSHPRHKVVVTAINGHPVDPLVTYQNRPPGMTVNQTPVLFFLDETNPYMTDNQAVTLTLTYPYPMFSNADLSDCFRLYLTGTSGVYELFFARHIVSVIFCLMICFFGLFAFPIAGCVIGGINPRYWAFSLLCFFSGLYLLSKVLAPFLPLWIDEGENIPGLRICDCVVGSWFGIHWRFQCRSDRIAQAVSLDHCLRLRLAWIAPEAIIQQYIHH